MSNPLGVAPLKSLGPVGIEHWHHVQLELFKQACDERLIPVPPDVVQDVSRATVAVGSSPCICDHNNTLNGPLPSHT